MSNGAKVGLTGRLTKDPVKKDYRGSTVVSFCVAVNTTKKEGDKYIADFYNVSAWGSLGDFILPRVKKGSLVQVYGDLQLQTYKDRNNADQKTLSVRAIDAIPLTSLTPSETKNNNDEDDGPPPF